MKRDEPSRPLHSLLDLTAAQLHAFAQSAGEAALLAAAEHGLAIAGMRDGVLTTEPACDILANRRAAIEKAKP